MSFVLNEGFPFFLSQLLECPELVQSRLEGGKLPLHHVRVIVVGVGMRAVVRLDVDPAGKGFRCLGLDVLLELQHVYHI